jgi:predicted peroxiredoxin
MARIITHATTGREDAERSTMPFVVANIAATAEQQAAVLLTIEGVWLATRQYAADIAKDGLPPLGELIGQFVANGGEIWACGACTKPRGITEDDLIPGARIVNAAFVVEQLAGGAATLEW